MMGLVHRYGPRRFVTTFGAPLLHGVALCGAVTLRHAMSFGGVSEVTCPKCLEKMASEVEAAMEEPDTMLAIGRALDQLAAGVGITRLGSVPGRRALETDVELRNRIGRIIMGTK